MGDRRDLKENSGDEQRTGMKINKKIAVIILVVAIIAIIAVIYIGGYIWKPLAYHSEREASDAITFISTSIDQIKSIIEDIDSGLG